MRPRNKLIDLGSLTWAAGAVQNVHLGALPKKHKVRSIELQVNLGGSCNAADAFDQRVFPLSLGQLSLSDLVLPVTGWQLAALLHKIEGRLIPSTGDIAAGGSTFVINYKLKVPFSDNRRQAPAHPDETAIPSELLAPHDLIIQWAAANVFNAVVGIDDATIIAGSMRVYADVVECREGDDAVVGEIRQIKTMGGSQDVTLESGAYVDILASARDAFALTTTVDIATAQVTVEGYPVMPPMPNPALRMLWDDLHGIDRLGPDATGSYWLPIVTPEKDGRSIRNPIVRGNGGRLITTGATTTPQFVAWVSKLKSAGDVLQVADRMGLSGVGAYEPAASGLNDVEAAILPAKLPGTGKPVARSLAGAPRPHSRD